MVREVARSTQLEGQVEEVREAFAIVQRMIEQGQREGTFRDDVDARLASWLLYGGLEEVLTGWVIGGFRPTTERSHAPSRPRSISHSRGSAPRLDADEGLQPPWRRVGSNRRSRGLAQQGRVGRRAHRRGAARRQHVRARAGRPAVAVPHPPCERGVAPRRARPADASLVRRASRTCARATSSASRGASKEPIRSRTAPPRRSAS